jgi:hypothetical protein
MIQSYMDQYIAMNVNLNVKSVGDGYSKIDVVVKMGAVRFY